MLQQERDIERGVLAQAVDEVRCPGRPSMALTGNMYILNENTVSAYANTAHHNGAGEDVAGADCRRRIVC